MKTKPGKGRGFDHLEQIAILAGYLAEKECSFRKITSPKKDKIIEKTILAGLLHDIERYRGQGEDHMIEGEKTARRILNQLNIDDEMVITVVKHHDHLDFKRSKNEVLEIVFGAVFDADHFRYSTEREEELWERRERKGTSPEKAIHDYSLVPPLRNAWRTNYGKQVGPKLIDYAMAIIKHIEKKFSQSITN